MPNRPKLATHKHMKLLVHYTEIDGSEEYVAIIEDLTQAQDELNEGYEITYIGELRTVSGDEDMLPCNRALSA